jgi:flavodoxin
MSSAVVYATEKGASQGVATEIGTKTGIQVIDAKTFPIDDIASYSLVIFVVSNYGKGDAPPSSKAVLQKLLALETDLSGLKFAVYTCGSSKFGPTFAGFGKKVERKLKDLKATQLGTLGIRDAAGANSTNFEEWITSLASSVNRPF